MRWRLGAGKPYGFQAGSWVYLVGVVDIGAPSGNAKVRFGCAHAGGKPNRTPLGGVSKKCPHGGLAF